MESWTNNNSWNISVCAPDLTVAGTHRCSLTSGTQIHGNACINTNVWSHGQEHR